MRNYTLGILILITSQVFSQRENYVEYYNLVNKAEEEFVMKMDSSCYKYYDMAFARNTPFMKDPYIAAQIALYLNDTLRFNHYLSVAFKNGMPLKSVTTSKFVRSRYYPQLYKKVTALYKQTAKPQLIDSVLLGKICLMCYQSDSLKLKTGGNSLTFHENENKTRAFILEELLKKGVFANEHLLGITSNDLWTEFYKKYDRKDLYASFGAADNEFAEEYELRLKCPMNILLHSQCFFRENKRLLLKAVQSGYLHPKDYGILEEASVLWFKESSANPEEKCESPAEIVSYNIFGINPGGKFQTRDLTEEGIKRSELNRSKIYMQKFSVDKLKKELEEKYGFAFFFDFVDRPGL